MGLWPSITATFADIARMTLTASRTLGGHVEQVREAKAKDRVKKRYSDTSGEGTTRWHSLYQSLKEQRSSNKVRGERLV